MTPAFGIPLPDQASRPVASMGAPSLVAAPPTASIGGIMNVASAATVLADRAREAAVQVEQGQPVIQSLVGHIKNFWQMANGAKQANVEPMMLEALYARRGQYTPGKRSELEASNQPVIFMMLTSMKCRQAESLLRDILIGSGTEKPWTIKPTPDPELPPSEVTAIAQAVMQEIMVAEAQGINVTIQQIKERLLAAREQLEGRVMQEAVVRAERMERKMEDQLAEGGFLNALDEFITDLTTFPAAFIKGPIVEKEKVLTWGRDFKPVVTEKLVKKWKRVDPFNIYPAPWAKDINDGPLIERHKLTRGALEGMLGTPGFSDNSIRQVLEVYGTGGLNEWLVVDASKAAAEGKEQLGAISNNSLIDALQYWGTASGKMLREWGMSATEVPDPAKEYHIEAWLIGSYVIKAVMNNDPLGRRNYYADSYERIPGTVWGNSIYNLMRDCQDMCNAAARAMSANMGIASGPQVAFNVDRLPVDENITEMYPWKIWQFTQDPMGSTAKPIEFFMPESNATQLMGVYDRFSLLADEYTGIPRYMTGTEGTPGAGRTASGLSMMIGNASKIIKQVISSVDIEILTPLLERLYFYNMVYSEDAELKGDVNIIARGALSLANKESAQVRVTEFLARTANDYDMQIMGIEGRAELLREAAKVLQLNTDKIVPSNPILRERAIMSAMAAAAAQTATEGGAPQQRDPSKEQLSNGAPVTDNFAPTPA